MTSVYVPTGYPEADHGNGCGGVRLQVFKHHILLDDDFEDCLIFARHEAEVLVEQLQKILGK